MIGREGEVFSVTMLQVFVVPVSTGSSKESWCYLVTLHAFVIGVVQASTVHSFLL